MNSTSVERLRAARGFVLDMDGTLVLADGTYGHANPLPGAVAFVERLTRHGIPFVIVTNGTARAPRDLSAMLTKAGLPTRPDQVITPTVVAARFLARRGAKSVLAITPHEGMQPFFEEGVEVVDGGKAITFDAVFVGWCRDYTLKDIERAAKAVLDGARFMTASNGSVYMTERGLTFAPSRAISAAIAGLTGRRPVLTGKPSAMAFRAATGVLGVPASDIVVVGDDAELEVELARRGDALAALVRTGVSGQIETNALPPRRRPDLHVNTLNDLLAFLPS